MMFVRFDIVSRYSQTIRRVFAPFGSSLLGFVYPPCCQNCGDELAATGLLFCDKCRTDLQPANRNECPRCGAPVGQYVDVARGCGQCQRESFAFDRVIRLGIYDGEMRRACLRAKAAHGSAFARGLASVLVHEKRAQFMQQPIDLIVPVPEHWTRRIGHLQYAAEALSREIGRRLLVPWSRSILIKRRKTPKQATSSMAKRRAQQQGSFRVRQAARIAGKTVLLVDDILTTGSTASAAARTLKQAGAKTVIVAVIAVTPLRK